MSEQPTDPATDEPAPTDPTPEPQGPAAEPLRSPFAQPFQRLYCAGRAPVARPGYLEALAAIGYAGLTPGEVVTIKASCPAPS